MDATGADRVGLDAMKIQIKNGADFNLSAHDESVVKAIIMAHRATMSAGDFFAAAMSTNTEELSTSRERLANEVKFSATEPEARLDDLRHFAKQAFQHLEIVITRESP